MEGFGKCWLKFSDIYFRKILKECFGKYWLKNWKVFPQLSRLNKIVENNKSICNKIVYNKIVYNKIV